MSEADALTPLTPNESLPVRDDSQTVLIQMQRSNLFRVIHTDGIWCSETPNRLVQLMFFNESLPLPEKTFYNLVNGKSLGEEQLERRVVDRGYVRDVEFAAVVDRATLDALYRWIGDYLERTKPEDPNVTA